MPKHSLSTLGKVHTFRMSSHAATVGSPAPPIPPDRDGQHPVNYEGSVMTLTQALTVLREFDHRCVHWVKALRFLVIWYRIHDPDVTDVDALEIGIHHLGRSIPCRPSNHTWWKEVKDACVEMRDYRNGKMASMKLGLWPPQARISRSSTNPKSFSQRGISTGTIPRCLNHWLTSSMMPI